MHILSANCMMNYKFQVPTRGGELDVDSIHCTFRNPVDGFGFRIEKWYVLTFNDLA